MTRLGGPIGFTIAMVSVLCQSAVVSGTPDDWPAWPGPAANGISQQTELIERFAPRGGEASNVVWKSVAASGISTPVAKSGRLYTIVRHQPGTPTEAEKVLCLDTSFGNATNAEIFIDNISVQSN